MPTQVEFFEYESVISSIYTLLQSVYAVCDGLKHHLKQSCDQIVQNKFYNGSMHDHYVSNKFVVALMGVIIAFVIIAPSALLNSVVAEMGGHVAS